MDLEVIWLIASALAFSWARMTAALIISIAFSIIVGIAAGSIRLLEKILIPILDILQSIPILSFFPLALYFFVILHPVIGPELAAVFLIFTSQVWNITFGVYESMKLLPTELMETSRMLGFGASGRLFRLYIPFAFPRIASNLPASWSNGLYFLVASEIITVGGTEVKLFGIGSIAGDFIATGRYLELAATLAATALAVILTTLIVFIPLIRLGERYKMEEVVSEVPRVWMERATAPLAEKVGRVIPRISFPRPKPLGRVAETLKPYLTTLGVFSGVAFLVAATYGLAAYLRGTRFTGFLSGFIKLGITQPPLMLGASALRVAAAIALTLLWALPLTILIHNRRRLEAIVLPALQVVASLPSPILAPFFMSVITDLGLPAELAALLIIIFGIQWYIFFSIYGGLKKVPMEEEEVCRLLGIRRLKKLRHLYLPRAMPSLITGCWVAMGGGWNTLVIAERLVIGGKEWAVEGPGIGKAISLAITSGDMATLAAATIYMAAFIVVLNRLFWRNLYKIAITKLKIP